MLKEQPMVKVTGDNLDLMIRTQHQASDHCHQDLHLFTSNIISHRVPLYNVSDCNPIIKLQNITPENFELNDMENHHLLESYSVLVGRILSEQLTAFHWMDSILPQHIKHTYSDYMAMKSEVHPLPIIMKNEAKYEECVGILDDYEEQLIELYTEAHGKFNLIIT